MGNSDENGKAPVVTDEVLVRFLLGELEDAERIQVAERLFSDDGLFDRLLEAENDLVDRYVTRELTARERELLEKAVREREPMRQKLAFALTLESALAVPARGSSGRLDKDRGKLKLELQTEDPNKPKVELQTPDSSKLKLELQLSDRSELEPVGVPTEARVSASRKMLWYGMAVAAALVITIGGAVWVIRHGQEPTRQTEEGLAVDQQPRESAQPSRDASGDLSKDAQHPPTIAPIAPRGGDRAETPTGTRPSHAQIVGTFVLLPGSTRSGEGEQILTIGSAVRSIRLHLQLDETDEYPSYDAILRTARGSIVSKRTDLHPRALPSGKGVTVELGAEGLAAGEYELELSGRGPAGPGTLVNYYYFGIAKSK